MLIRFLNSIRRSCFGALAALALSLGVTSSHAASVTDLWSNPNEQGWGMNVIEQQGLLFVTLFVYGSNGAPTWLVASGAAETGSTTTTRRFTGALFTTNGSFFGSPTFGAVTARQVGTLTFTVNSPGNTGTVAYSVDGVSVTKSVQRQTFKHINIGGTFSGGVDALSSSTCPASTLNNGNPIAAVVTLTATVNANQTSGTLSMTITFPDNSSMSFSGNYNQFGLLYLATGTVNSGGTVVNAQLQDFTSDDDGIRGNLLLQGGCTLNMRIAAVRPG